MIIQDFNHRYVGVPEGINVEMRAWYNPNLQTQWNIVTALIGTLSFIQVLMLSALSVAREREYGTFDQLLVSPYRPFEILLAKATPPIFIGIAQTLLSFFLRCFGLIYPCEGLFYRLFRDFHFYVIDSRNRTGDFFHIADDAAGDDFLVCADCSNGYFVGLVTPVYNMPEILQVLTYADPLRFALEYVHGVYLENLSISELWGQLLPMLITAVITLPFAAFFFRRSL